MREARLLLSWLDWMELEAEGVDARLVEGLRRLRGAVVAVPAVKQGPERDGTYVTSRQERTRSPSAARRELDGT